MSYLVDVDVTEVGLNGTATDPAHLPGSIYRAANGKLYKYVKYDDGTGNLDLAAGDVVHYIDDTGYGANTVGADVTDLTGDGIPAGVAPVAVTVDGSYFWIQIRGAATLSTAIESSNDATPVAAGDGDPLVLGDADKTLRRQNTTIDADAERILECGVAVDASAKEIICMFPE